MLRFTKILKIRKTQLALAIILALGFSLIPAHGTNAAGWFNAVDTAGGLVVGLINSMLSLVIYILGMILAGIATMADSLMQPVAITTNAAVQQGWGITRDFANMFFILILLAIALDFILFNSFRVKQMIPRLILVALLINFSLPIAGVLIDFANVFTQFFLSQASSTTGFTAVIANNLNISHILDATKSGLETGNALSIETNLFKTLIFAVIFMFGTAFVFLALALMFLVRTGYLYVLLITLPLVLVLSAFPPTAGYFKSWTNNFIKWTMFAPIATFFLYFALLMFNELLVKNIAVVSDDSFITSIYKYIVIWVFLLGALTAANSMGGKTAGMAMGAANWVKTKTTKGLKRGGAVGLTAAGRGVGADEQLSKLASNIQKAVPGWIGGNMLASGVRGLSVKTKTAMEQQEALTPKEKAKYEAMSVSDLKRELGSYKSSKLPGSRAKVGLISEILTKKGELVGRNSDGTVNVDVTKQMVREGYQALKTHKNKAGMRTLLRSNPIIAKEIIDEEWKEDLNKGDAAMVLDPTTNKMEMMNKNTGKKYQDAANEIFDMSKNDFENMKGQWDKDSVNAFIESGYLTSGYLKQASENADSHFVNFVGDYYRERDALTGNAKITAIAKAKKDNPGLTNAYRYGRLSDFGLGKPNNLQEWQ